MLLYNIYKNDYDCHYSFYYFYVNVTTINFTALNYSGMQHVRVVHNLM